MKKKYAPLFALLTTAAILVGFYIDGFDFDTRGGVALFCYAASIGGGAFVFCAVRDLGEK